MISDPPFLVEDPVTVRHVVKLRDVVFPFVAGKMPACRPQRVFLQEIREAFDRLGRDEAADLLPADPDVIEPPVLGGGKAGIRADHEAVFPKVQAAKEGGRDMSLENEKKDSLEKLTGAELADEDLENVSGGTMAVKRSFATGVGHCNIPGGSIRSQSANSRRNDPSPV